MGGPTDHDTKWNKSKTNIRYHLYVESKNMIHMNFKNSFYFYVNFRISLLVRF